MVPRPRRPSWLLLLPAAAIAASPECKDSTTCQARMASLVERLGTIKDEMRGKQLTLSALEDLRTGILSGKRIEMPSAQRQHLERGSPLISEVSFDARHRPVSTNVSRHFKLLRTVAPEMEVRIHTFLMLKRSSASPKAGPSALLVIVDAASRLSVFDFEGDPLLDSFDLGHGDGRVVTQLVLSPNQEKHFVLSVDDAGDIRVHDLKIVGKKEKKSGKKGKPSDEGPEREAPKKQLTVSTNFSGSFSLPAGSGGEPRKLTAVLPIDRGSQTYIVTGDSLGGISVFFRNGTMKGRVRVTEDPGGVQGLLRSQGQMILYYSSHSFGFFSSTQIDVQYPPCSGWNSPLYDVAIDPMSASNRVVLALSDGDVIVFSTTHGKSKACDLSLKFPHVSALPFKLHAFKGHIMALPTPLPSTPRKADYLREIYFFNLAAMDAGYGLAPSRAVVLQASFKPQQPDSLALSASTAPGDRAKSQIAIRFEGQKGVELYDLSLKQPSAPKQSGGGGGGGNDDGWGGWLNWFPKIGVFGIALVGVVIWNVKKVAGNRQDPEPFGRSEGNRSRLQGDILDRGGLRSRSGDMPDIGGLLAGGSRRDMPRADDASDDVGEG